MHIDDGADLYLEGVRQINRFGIGGGVYSFSYAMTADTNYYLTINWQENAGQAKIELYWSYTGVATTLIPPTNFVWPKFVGSSPYTFTVTCPTGYTAVDAAHPNE